MVRLGDVGELIRSSGIRRSETIPSGLPCLRYGEIYTSFEFVLDKPKSFVEQKIFDSCPHIETGDVVFSLTGENKEEIAKALAYTGKDLIAAGGDLAIWKNHGCDSKYLAYLMYSPAMLKAKADASNGQIIVHASVKKLQDIRIPLPPLAEQKRIVAKLEKELARVKAMKAKFERMATAAENVFKATLEEMLSNASKNVVTLESICEPIKDGTHQTPTYSDEEHGVMFLSSKDVSTGRIDWKHVKYIDPMLHVELSKRVAPRKGDVLLAKNGTTGIAAIVDRDVVFDIYVTLALLRVRSLCNNKYLWYAVNSPIAKEQFNKRLKGMGVPNLHLVEIRQVQIPLPPLPAQREIVARLDAAKARCEGIAAKARVAVATCEKLRKAILAEAFR